MRALVTGASGFIGAHVVRTLIGAGHEVRSLCLPSDQAPNLVGVPTTRVFGDVASLEDVRRAADGCDWVFHLAAVFALWTKNPKRMWDVNVGGTQNVLQAARELGIARVIHTSSIARFGGQGPGVDATERSPYRLGRTGDLYSDTKQAAHELAVDAARKGQDVVIVAPCGPLGPGDVGPTPTGRLLVTSVKMPVAVVVDTETNFGDVRDMAQGHLLAAVRGRSGESYLLGHQNVSMAELARLARKAMGLRARVLVINPALVSALGHGLVCAAERWGAAPILTPAAVRIAQLGLRANCAKAKTELGLPSRPLEQSITDALMYFGLLAPLPRTYPGQGQIAL
jgi:dihydroflavonol-4-reductase